MFGARVLFTSVLVKSGGYLSHRFLARQIYTNIHLRFGEYLLIQIKCSQLYFIYNDLHVYSFFNF